MIYLLAIVLPPIYFLVKKRWAAFIVTSALLVGCIFLLFMVILAPLVPILWALCAAIAIWDIRKHVTTAKSA